MMSKRRAFWVCHLPALVSWVCLTCSRLLDADSSFKTEAEVGAIRGLCPQFFTAGAYSKIWFQEKLSTTSSTASSVLHQHGDLLALVGAFAAYGFSRSVQGGRRSS